MADWPHAEGTRIEVASMVRTVAATADWTNLDFVELSRSFAWCRNQKEAAEKLVDFSAGAVTIQRAQEIVGKALEARLKIIGDQKSDFDVTAIRESK
jgi:hypothetical protein